MSSIPYCILSTQDEKILPLTTIQEHQKFCKSFLALYENRKSKDELHLSKKKQKKIFKWFKNLTENQKINICTIKNKWLVNILIQLYLIYNTYDSCYIKPSFEMANLFQAQKNFCHCCNNINFQNLNDCYSYTNMQNNNNKSFRPNDLNFYENFFQIIYANVNIFNDKETKKRDVEKNFIDKIKIISLEEDYLDTITLSKDILVKCEEIQFYLDFFSEGKYFQDWLLPIKENNLYNFVLPNWMHNNQSLTIFHLIIGYIEQQIILNYEYFYYSNKLYEYPYIKKIIDLYEENEKLVTFVKENYSYHGNSNTEKKELISRLEIRDIVRDIQNNAKYQDKIKYIENMYYSVFNDVFNSENNNSFLNKDFEKQTYIGLYDEMIKERDNAVEKIIDHITFMKFSDIINCRDNVFSILRKNICNNHSEKIVNELISGNVTSDSNNKNKNKNKKKKKKNKKKENIENFENNNIIKNEDIKSNKEIALEDKKEGRNSSEKSDNIIKDNSESKKIKIEEFDFNDNGKNRDDININNINNRENVIKDDIKAVNLNNFISNDENSDNGKININNIKKEEKINNIGEINHLHQKKNKNNDFFLYPICSNVKKKNKKKKNINSLISKKEQKLEIKINIEKNKDYKTNSTPTKINNIKNSKLAIFDNCFKDEQKNNNINKSKSLSPLSSKQNQLFSFIKPKKDIIKNNIAISSDKSKNIDKTEDNILKIEKSSYLSFENINNLKENNLNVNNNINNYFNNNNDIYNTNNINNNEDNYNINNYSNSPIISNVYSPFNPSEKFFESLTNEISNYISVTNQNMTNINAIHLKHLDELEKLIKASLESKYEIKYAHYGSHFTNLSIEGSDLDILINYKSKNNEKTDFFEDILSILNKNEKKFSLIQPILTANVPVIKLQIDIKNEINDIKLNKMPYFEDDNELSKVNFDLTFTQDEKEYQHCQQIVSYINKSLVVYPIIKSLMLILKRYFKIMKMNKSFHGGLSSYSLYLLLYSFCKKFPVVISSLGKAIYSFLAFFSMFDFENYGVDIENINIYYYLNNNDINNNNINNIDEQNKKKEINIIDPLTKLNVAKSSFKVEEIKNTFLIGYNFLRVEGYYYDYELIAKKSGYDNNYFNKIITDYDKDKDINDFKTIKKLFGLYKKPYFFDFFPN